MRIRRFVYLWIEKILSKHTDKIVCISEAEKCTALREHICEDGKLCLIPNGIDITKVMKAEPVSKKSIGIGEDDYVVGMIGRLSRQKAPDVFVKAAELIQQRISKVAFIIVGDGEEVEEIKIFGKEHGLNLVVTGWVDNPYNYLKLFDVAILLSRWEGFGLAIAEYMAAQKPIVATRIDAIPSLIEEGKDGFLVNVDSPKEAAEKVFFIHDHPQEVRCVVEAAFRKVKQCYDIHRVAEQHQKLFNDLTAI